MFVGNEFYRKGGAEIVLALSELVEAGQIDASQLDVQLIGDLNKRHNVAHRQFQDDDAFYRTIQDRISRLSFITHHSQMANPELLKLFQRSDLGLLPTWQETYGFSVLEMQASGCPVLTSNVRALPEINPASAGWTIGGMLNDDREYQVNSEADKHRLRRALIDGLKSTLLDILTHPQVLTEKAEGSILRIKQQHDPRQYCARLNEIYRRGVVDVVEHPPAISI